MIEFDQFCESKNLNQYNFINAALILIKKITLTAIQRVQGRKKAERG